MTLIKNDNYKLEKSHVMGLFSNNDGAGFFEWCAWTPKKELEMLTFRLSKKPKFLEAHVERIYHCLAHGLNNQLYGALVDLLIVLKGCGLDLFQRMLGKCKTNLTQREYQILADFSERKSADVEFLNNRYALFTRGVQSNNILIRST